MHLTYMDCSIFIKSLIHVLYFYSSPLISHHQTPPVHEDLPDQITAPELQLEARCGIELEEKVETSQANKESNFLEKNSIPQHSPDPFAEKKRF